MARKRAEPKAWTASQVVAHNLTRARKLRGMSQAEIAERLTRLTGTNWAQATVAQAEGSVSGERVRQFTANELVALARTFDLPLLYFFLPPEDMLAVAFNGLARRRVRGAMQTGDDVSSVVESLRGLADTLEAFANHTPGTFLDAQEVRQMAERERRRAEEENP